MRYCTNCGAKVEDEFKFCADCGLNLEKTRTIISDGVMNIESKPQKAQESFIDTGKSKISSTVIKKGGKSKTARLLRASLLIVILAFLVVFYSYSVKYGDIKGTWKADTENLEFELKIYENEGHLSISEKMDGYSERIAFFSVSIIEDSGNYFVLNISGREYEIVKSTANSFNIEFNGVYTKRGWITEEVEFYRN